MPASLSGQLAMRHGRLGRPERMRDGMEIGFGRTCICAWRLVILAPSPLDVTVIRVVSIIEVCTRRLNFGFEVRLGYGLYTQVRRRIYKSSIAS